MAAARRPLPASAGRQAGQPAAAGQRGADRPSPSWTSGVPAVLAVGRWGCSRGRAGPRPGRDRGAGLLGGVIEQVGHTPCRRTASMRPARREVARRHQEGRDGQQGEGGRRVHLGPGGGHGGPDGREGRYSPPRRAAVQQSRRPATTLGGRRGRDHRDEGPCRRWRRGPRRGGRRRSAAPATPATAPTVTTNSVAAGASPSEQRGERVKPSRSWSPVASAVRTLTPPGPGRSERSSPRRSVAWKPAAIARIARMGSASRARSAQAGRRGRASAMGPCYRGAVVEDKPATAPDRTNCAPSIRGSAGLATPAVDRSPPPLSCPWTCAWTSSRRR